MLMSEENNELGKKNMLKVNVCFDMTIKTHKGSKKKQKLGF